MEGNFQLYNIRHNLRYSTVIIIECESVCVCVCVCVFSGPHRIHLSAEAFFRGNRDGHGRK